MNNVKDKKYCSNHMKSQYYLLSHLKQNSQRNNWISLTKKIDENTNIIEELEKQNHDFSESFKNY